MKLWILDLMTIQLFLLYMVKPPNPYDTHGCCLSCGFNWCDTLNECVRVWETYCESLENGGH